VMVGTLSSIATNSLDNETGNSLDFSIW